MASNTLEIDAQFTFTRPADVLVYAAGDQIANSVTAGSVIPITIPVAALKGKGGVIKNASLIKSTTSITLADFRLYLFSALPTQVGDNVALAPSLAELRTLLGWFPFSNAVNLLQFTNGVFYTGYPAAAVQQPTLSIPETCDGNVYGVLIATAAYVPASAEQFTIKLVVERN